jgi:type IV pilus assembly protein PilB
LSDATSPVELADDLEISEHVVELLPETVARENLVLPVAETADALVLAVADSAKTEAIDTIRFVLNRSIRVICVTDDWMRAQLRKYYGGNVLDGE